MPTRSGAQSPTRVANGHNLVTLLGLLAGLALWLFGAVQLGRAMDQGALGLLLLAQPAWLVAMVAALKGWTTWRLHRFRCPTCRAAIPPMAPEPRQPGAPLTRFCRHCHVRWQLGSQPGRSRLVDGGFDGMDADGGGD
ncbi:hypothetical protein [Gallaecimonas sp. GXIMD4217]|uniref:hypothetical protein n=1 Tax=Gallaecimonas sp. GXIMD4217 TaxID=3131927 RepID=UPI00311ACFAC